MRRVYTGNMLISTPKDRAGARVRGKEGDEIDLSPAPGSSPQGLSPRGSRKPGPCRPTQPISQLLLHDRAGERAEARSPVFGPCVWSARRLLPWSCSPSASGKGLAPVGSLFIVHLSTEPRAQARQGSAGHCRLQVPLSRALPFNPFIPKGLRMLAPAVSPPYVS